MKSVPLDSIRSSAPATWASVRRRLTGRCFSELSDAQKGQAAHLSGRPADFGPIPSNWKPPSRRGAGIVLV